VDQGTAAWAGGSIRAPSGATHPHLLIAGIGATDLEFRFREARFGTFDLKRVRRISDELKVVSSPLAGISVVPAEMSAIGT